MKKTNMVVATIVGLLALFVCGTLLFRAFHVSGPDAKRVTFLVNELTISSARQQSALDELAHVDDVTLFSLTAFFDDRRRLASPTVRFLNLYEGAHEAYFLTEATTIDEMALRFVCWRTKQCNPGFRENDESAKAEARGRIRKFCRDTFLSSEKPQDAQICGASIDQTKDLK